MNALDHATSFASLRAVWKVYGGRLRQSCFGVDRRSGEHFGRHLDRELRELRYRLNSDFKCHGLLALAKPKPGGFRIICVPTIADRLLQFSLLNHLRPKLRQMGLDNGVSYGLAKGAERSVLGARKFACSARNEKPWVYKTDIQKFFDNIGRSKLESAVEKIVRQTSLVPILKSFLHCEIEDGLDPKWRAIVTENGLVKGHGVRQGMPLSPLFAGAYLRDIDRFIISTGVPAARYVDDIVAFFESEAEALQFHAKLRDQLHTLGLNIGEPGAPNSKTAIYAPGRPASFLGMEISWSPMGEYRLIIGAESIAKVIAKFADAGTSSALLDRRVTLTTMGNYFRSLSFGYLNAYSEAQNRDDLRDAMLIASQKSQHRVFVELFGEEQFATMGASHQRFVGILQDAPIDHKTKSARRRGR